MKRLYCIFVLLIVKAYGAVVDPAIIIPSDLTIEILMEHYDIKNYYVLDETIEYKSQKIKNFESFLTNLHLIDKALYFRINDPNMWEWIKSKSFINNWSNPDIFVAAVNNNCYMIIKLLSDIGYKIENYLEEINIPLYQTFLGATLYESTLMIKLLSERGYSLYNFLIDINKEKEFVFYYAIVTDNWLLVKLLIDSGVDLNHELKNISSLKREAELFDYYFLEDFFHGNVHFLYTHLSSIPPLILAIRHNSSKVAKFLINIKVNLEARDAYGCTALMHAICVDKVDMVRILVEQGVELNYLNNCELYKHWLSLLPLANFIDSGVDLFNLVSNFYNDLSELKSFKFLLDKISIDNKGYSCLMIAVLFGNIEIVEMLLKSGADINLKNTHKETAMLLAIISRNLPIIKLLIKYKETNYDLEKLADYVINSFEIDVKERVEILYELLRNKKINNFNIKDHNGYSLLMLSVQADNEHVVRYLISNGVDVFYKIHEETALDISICLRRDNLSRLLLS